MRTIQVLDSRQHERLNVLYYGKPAEFVYGENNEIKFLPQGIKTYHDEARDPQRRLIDTLIGLDSTVTFFAF